MTVGPGRPARAFVLLLAAAALAAGPVTARARPPGLAANSLAAATVKAHGLIEAAVRRVGGAEKLRALAGLHLVMDGEVYNGLQGYDPADLTSGRRMGATTLSVDFDYAHHRYRRDVLQVLPGDVHLDVVTYFKDGRATTTYPGRGRMVASAEPESAFSNGLIARYSPVLLARLALANIRSATFIGQRLEGGRRQNLVEVSADLGARIRLHLDARDSRILSAEAVGADPLTGEADLRYVYDGERVVDGLAFAERVTVLRHGRPYIRVRAREITVDPSFQAAAFDAPALQPLTTATGVNPLGGGAYEITGIDGGAFREVFFDLGDGVAVFDAPESRARSAWVVEQIRRTLGPKPVKYVILSHFHDDHVAGIGYYVDQGARIVTVRANAPVVRRYATTDSRLRPDLPAEGRPPRFLFLDGDRLDLPATNGQAVSIYKLADCPHAKDMLVAYQASGKLIVQADLFVDLAPFSGASAAFSAWMKRPAAPPVERIVGTHLAEVSRAAFEAEAPAGKV